jgi:DNA-binding CsgD family transcriptional regulator
MGTIWLTMKLVDLSPVQDLSAPATAVFSNKKTREVVFTMVGGENIIDLITKREKQILKMIAGGMRSKEIADQLFISANTVNNHRKNLMDKLNVTNSTEAVTQGIKMGII